MKIRTTPAAMPKQPRDDVPWFSSWEPEGLLPRSSFTISIVLGVRAPDFLAFLCLAVVPMP